MCRAKERERERRRVREVESRERETHQRITNENNPTAEQRSLKQSTVYARVAKRLRIHVRWMLGRLAALLGSDSYSLTQRQEIRLEQGNECSMPKCVESRPGGTAHESRAARNQYPTFGTL